MAKIYTQLDSEKPKYKKTVCFFIFLLFVILSFPVYSIETSTQTIKYYFTLSHRDGVVNEVLFSCSGEGEEIGESGCCEGFRNCDGVCYKCCPVSCGSNEYIKKDSDGCDYCEECEDTSSNFKCPISNGTDANGCPTYEEKSCPSPYVVNNSCSCVCGLTGCSAGEYLDNTTCSCQTCPTPTETVCDENEVTYDMNGCPEQEVEQCCIPTNTYSNIEFKSSGTGSIYWINEEKDNEFGIYLIRYTGGFLYYDTDESKLGSLLRYCSGTDIETGRQCVSKGKKLWDLWARNQNKMMELLDNAEPVVLQMDEPFAIGYGEEASYDNNGRMSLTIERYSDLKCVEKRLEELCYKNSGCVSSSERKCEEQSYLDLNGYCASCYDASYARLTTEDSCMNACGGRRRVWRDYDSKCFSCDYSKAIKYTSKKNCLSCPNRYWTGTNESSGTCYLCAKGKKPNANGSACE